MKQFLLLTSLIASLLLSGSATSLAAGINKQKAASIAKSRYQGRVIDVKQVRKNSGSAFRVKILDKKGGMHIVVVNQQNGNIISAH